jgi:hypothetical protein
VHKAFQFSERLYIRYDGYLLSRRATQKLTKSGEFRGNGKEKSLGFIIDLQGID